MTGPSSRESNLGEALDVDICAGDMQKLGRDMPGRALQSGWEETGGQAGTQPCRSPSFRRHAVSQSRFFLKRATSRSTCPKE